MQTAVLYQPTGQSLLWYVRPPAESYQDLFNCRPIVRSESLDALVAHVWRSVGFSGRNKVRALLLFLVHPLHPPRSYNPVPFGNNDKLISHIGLSVPTCREYTCARTCVVRQTLVHPRGGSSFFTLSFSFLSSIHGRSNVSWPSTISANQYEHRHTFFVAVSQKKIRQLDKESGENVLWY